MPLDDPYEQLRRLCPWPESRPDVSPIDHGWFQAGSIKLLGERLNADTKLVVELGSWLGQSTRWILDHAPNAAVVAIDHWEGSEEHFTNPDPRVQAALPVLYETFLTNLWDYRDRLHPYRTDTLEGMNNLRDEGLFPDIVFVDADHTEQGAYHDVKTAAELFPDAKLVGDDWLWDTVRRAVERFATESNLEIVVDRNAWALEPKR